MKKLKQRLFATLLLLLPLCSFELWAQVTAGGVYNFVNGENKQSMSAPSMEVVSSKGTDLKDYSQLWYAESVSEGKFALRNMSNGMYLKSTQGGPWTLVATREGDCALSCEGSANPIKIKNTQGNNYMHMDTGQGRVVSWWDGNANKSKWNITAVEFTPEQIQKNWDDIAAFNEVGSKTAQYQQALNALFADQACTKLKNPGVGAGDANYDVLPAELKAMVNKVKSGHWEEANADSKKLGWGTDYAKKFRVQLYEPYSDPAQSAAAVKINHHSNLNNPTGLYANNRQILYVMVEGEIKQGATLYLSSVVGHNLPDGNCRSGIQLHEGLNVVPYWSDGNAVHINYVVETFKDGQMTEHKLSQYEPLKIHIEGGHINGYFNAVGDKLYTKDTNADWQYYEDRANLEDIIILGKYQTIQFYLNDTNGSHGLRHYFPEADVNAVIAEWDRIMMCERLTMGLLSKEEVAEANRLYPTLDDKKRGIYSFIGGEAEGSQQGFYKDYSDSYRLHGLSFGTTYNYMFGSNEYSGYNVNTFGDIIGNITKAAGPIWGPAHEIGHQHQRLLNMNGLTEVSNNIFSNVAVWYNGKSTSRINVDGGDLMSLLQVYNQENSDFFTNDRWALTQMNYKLWLYYHLAGHNNKFYPRLFEILRNDPMQISSTQDGATSLLHLYKKTCQAAGEDLTDFFRAYGMFRPMDNRFVDDYTKSHYTMTQKQIDEAIAEVKSWNLPENHVLMLINDATADVTYGHDGTTPRARWSGVCSDLGCYKGFYVNQESKVTTPYICQMEGNMVKMSAGKGGVGFLVYDDKGELLAFSDHFNFPVSARTQMALAKGYAKIYVANGDNSMVEVKIQNAAANEKNMLTELMAEVDQMLALEDATGTKVGFYHAEALADLKATRAKAGEILEAGVAGTYLSVYEVLNDEIKKLQNNAFAKVNVVEGSAYALVNRSYTTYSMSVEANKEMKATAGTSESQQWYLESAGGAGVYYIKSKTAGTYVNAVRRSQQLKADVASDAEKMSYKLSDMGAGYFALICQDRDGQALHCDAGKKIVGWDATSTASQWHIQAVELSALDAAKENLKILVAQTNELMNECGRVISGKVPLTEANLSSNADQNIGGNNKDGGGVAALVDNNVATYFHSRWNGTVVNEAHYIQVDLGADMGLDEFKLSYTTRGGQGVSKDRTSPAPTAFTLKGSTDGQVYTDIASFTKEGDALPAHSELGKQWTSGVLKGNHCRYLRFVVTASAGPAPNPQYGGQYFFGLAELGLEVSNNVVLNEAFRTIPVNLMKEAYDKVKAANEKLSAAATADEIQTASQALQTSYRALLDARNQVLNAGLNAKKEQLKALIEQTTALVNQCGHIQEQPGNQVVLQTTAANAANYLSSNADQNAGDGGKDGDGVAALLDNKVETYFHSRWGGKPAVKEPHYLQVDLGENKRLDEFRLSYTTRGGQGVTDNNTSPAPTAFTLKGSTDGQSYTDIASFTKEGNALPAYTEFGKQWTSGVLQGNRCRYLRFVVTKSDGPGKELNENQYFFALSEFGLAMVVPQVVINEAYVEVTAEQWLATYHAVAAAQTTYDIAKTEAQVDVAIHDLQVKHGALQASVDASKSYTLKVSKYRYAGLYLKRNAVIPEGVKVYTASQVNGSSVRLEPITSGILPANTGVIVEAEQGDHVFTYTDQAATAASLLKGSAVLQYLQGETNHNYYLFGVKTVNGEKKVALYKAWLEYNAQGQKSHPGTDEGGYFKVSANKIYLDLVGSASVNHLNFVFGDVTGIEDAAVDVKEAVIYNLQGRRVYKVEQSGLYIVNGQKKFIKK